jgi:alanine racemase
MKASVERTRAWAEIDLSALEANLLYVKRLTGAGVKVLLPVKSDAYGHGAAAVSAYVERRGLADMLGVSTPAEGIELREAGIRLPILNLGIILPERDIAAAVVRHDIAQTVADPSLAALLAREARGQGRVARLHLKVDTGMGRIGCAAGEAAEIAWALRGIDGAALEGIYSHFPVSDAPGSGFTRGQIARFREIIDELESRGIRLPFIHMANSGGVLHYPESHLALVRPGIMAYGYAPAPDSGAGSELAPVMSLRSVIVFMKRVPAGTPLSYGLTYSPAREANIATVPVGYGDGYSRLLSNRARVVIRGKEYPVAGTVCMDQVLVDLGPDEYPVGEEVTLFGRGRITAGTIARWMGTIPYEVLCGISKRIPRIYVNEAV